MLVHRNSFSGSMHREIFSRLSVLQHCHYVDLQISYQFLRQMCILGVARLEIPKANLRSVNFPLTLEERVLKRKQF
jgi:hypothetical protein